MSQILFPNIPVKTALTLEHEAEYIKAAFSSEYK